MRQHAWLGGHGHLHSRRQGDAERRVCVRCALLLLLLRVCVPSAWSRRALSALRSGREGRGVLLAAGRCRQPRVLVVLLGRLRRLQLRVT